MQILRLLDLVIYFLAGLFLYLYIDSRKQANATEKRTTGQQCKRWAMAIVMGLVFAGGRFLFTYAGKLSALHQLPFHKTVDPLGPPTIGDTAPAVEKTTL